MVSTATKRITIPPAKKLAAASLSNLLLCLRWTNRFGLVSSQPAMSPNRGILCRTPWILAGPPDFVGLPCGDGPNLMLKDPTWPLAVLIQPN